MSVTVRVVPWLRKVRSTTDAPTCKLWTDALNPIGGKAWVHRQGMLERVGFDGEVAEQLDGEHPSLERPLLLAGEDAAGASDGEGLAGLGVLAQHRALLP